MRERVILSIINNITINRETRANAIDNTTRARDEGFNVDVCFSADYEKFDLNLFIANADTVVESFIIRAIIADIDVVVESFIMKTIITDADTVVKNFIMRAMSFEMLVIRYSLSVFSIANADI